MTADDAITVVPFATDKEAEWASFLAASANGTLFHDLAFLAYHPAGRFDFHHLLFSRKGVLCALLPAAVSMVEGTRMLVSPAGASIGGFALAPGLSPLVLIDLCRSVQDYARGKGWDGIEMRIPPGIYHREPNDGLGFALAATGFSLVRRWLTICIPLPEDVSRITEAIPKKRRIAYLKSAEKEGVTVLQAGPERLDDFYPVLLKSQARHQAMPAHTLAELRDLFARKPGRFRLFLCDHAGRAAGGTLVFELNDRVAYTFYICHDEAFEDVNPAAVAILHAMEEYTRRGFRYLDLGPSGNVRLDTRQHTLNTGGAFFKQKLGGVGFCRDTWRWTAGDSPRTPEVS
jgi:hypothetical protein